MWIQLSSAQRDRFRGPLIAGDANYIPAEKVAKDEGVFIKLLRSGAFQTDSSGRRHPKYGNELWDNYDEREVISQDLIDRCKIDHKTVV